MEKQINERSRRKIFAGIVVSTKMAKTIVVEVETKTLHPRYRKLVIRHKKYHVHDPKSEAKLNDKVRIIETRPISKTKFYRLLKITERAK
ncbi:MAG: 30S ribosomal protein S17 [Mycoplasmataceae bacterium]|jgi:small subunit ribosomal protein S17|nr:30S ribosomal protein S17 [Mycoplasmataceae bacterium]